MSPQLLQPPPSRGSIRVEALGKRFIIGAPEKYRTLREVLSQSVAPPSRWLRRRSIAKPSLETFWALRDVSFEVKPGEVMGIIGRNGAGKSTLLKILSRITEPTEGRAEISGRVGSLLEVGTGFHPELTGRENILLNGAILGMKRAEILRKFDEIVAFSEVERFIDTPVKHYSSGMYVRLAFAVAAHMEPEILIVDEVLAVGDATFQRKCLGKMRDVAGEGRTVLFVSHNMGAVQNLCDRCVWLQEGRVASTGDSATVIREYLRNGESAYGRLDTGGRVRKPSHAVIRDAWIEREGVQVGHVIFGDQIDLVMQIQVIDRVTLAVELVLRQADGVPVAFGPSGWVQDLDIEAKPGALTMRAHLPPACLAIGGYSIDLALAETGIRLLDHIESGIRFHVDSAVAGSRNWAFSQNRGQGHALWDVNFEFAASGATESDRCVASSRP